MPHLKILHHAPFGQDILQQRAELWDIPLPISKLTEQASFRHVRRRLKGLIIRPACQLDAQAAIQHQQRIPNGADDPLQSQQRGHRLIGRRREIAER